MRIEMLLKSTKFQYIPAFFFFFFFFFFFCGGGGGGGGTGALRSCIGVLS